MTDIRHGFTLHFDRTAPRTIVILHAYGTLTHQDYLTMTPSLEGIIKQLQEVYLLLDCQHLKGWQLQAAWDDFRLGMKHHSHFKKIAILGDEKWLQVASKVAGWFVDGEVKILTDLDQARDWLYQ